MMMIQWIPRKSICVCVCICICLRITVHSSWKCRAQHFTASSYIFPVPALPTHDWTCVCIILYCHLYWSLQYSVRQCLCNTVHKSVFAIKCLCNRVCDILLRVRAFLRLLHSQARDNCRPKSRFHSICRRLNKQTFAKMAAANNLQNKQRSARRSRNNRILRSYWRRKLPIAAKKSGRRAFFLPSPLRMKCKKCQKENTQILYWSTWKANCFMWSELYTLVHSQILSICKSYYGRPFCATRYFTLALEFTQDQYFTGFSAIHHMRLRHI